MDEKIGRAQCPGTCGEWVQGARSGIPFLVDCPIDRFSEATVRLIDRNNGWRVPDGKTKVARALDLIWSERGIEHLVGEVSFGQELPEGKGMASSTADIVASAAAALTALGEVPAVEHLARLAVNIEPSDSVMFPGITEFNHVHGNNYRILGPIVEARFLALDWGGFVNTLDFNARQDLAAHYRRSEQAIRRASELVMQGIELRDLEKLVAGATLSARNNLEINPKPHFEAFYKWVRQCGGLGIVTAHSGTLLAGVFVPNTELGPLVAEVQERFQPAYVDVFKAYGNGMTVHDIDQCYPDEAGERKSS